MDFVRGRDDGQWFGVGSRDDWKKVDVKSIDDRGWIGIGARDYGR